MSKEITITSEFLATLYSRANQFCVAKFNREPDRILIKDGSLEAVWDGYEPGDEDYETVNPEDLTEDLDAVAAERKKREEEKRIREEQQRKKEKEQWEKREKESRRQQFIKLKKEFEP